MGEDRFHDNQTRQTPACAGHAHTGVLIILSVICQILVDFIDHTQALSWFIRIGLLTGSPSCRRVSGRRVLPHQGSPKAQFNRFWGDFLLAFRY